MKYLLRTLAWAWLALITLVYLGFVSFVMWRMGHFAIFLGSLAAGLMTTLSLHVLLTSRKAP